MALFMAAILCSTASCQALPAAVLNNFEESAMPTLVKPLHLVDSHSMTHSPNLAKKYSPGSRHGAPLSGKGRVNVPWNRPGQLGGARHLGATESTFNPDLLRKVNNSSSTTQHSVTTNGGTTTTTVITGNGRTTTTTTTNGEVDHIDMNDFFGDEFFKGMDKLKRRAGAKRDDGGLDAGASSNATSSTTRTRIRSTSTTTSGSGQVKPTGDVINGSDKRTTGDREIGDERLIRGRHDGNIVIHPGGSLQVSGEGGPFAPAGLINGDITILTGGVLKTSLSGVRSESAGGGKTVVRGTGAYINGNLIVDGGQVDMGGGVIAGSVEVNKGGKVEIRGIILGDLKGDGGTVHFTAGSMWRTYKHILPRTYTLPLN